LKNILIVILTMSWLTLTIGCDSSKSSDANSSSSAISSSSTNSFSSSISSEPNIACDTQYSPICASKQVQCIAAPCYSISTTYPNLCEFNKDTTATYIHHGECNTTSISRAITSTDSLVISSEKFGHDLFKRHANNKENLLISPFSIYSALSMLYAGTASDTAKELEDVMYFDQNLSVHNSFKELLAMQTNRANRLNVANSIWPNSNFVLSSKFSKVLQDDYKSSITPLDYSNATSYKTINAWVEDHTEEKIKDLLSPLSSTTKIVLVNAIYFLGNWLTEFDANSTTQAPFYLDGGDSVDVQMMSLETELNVSSNAMFKSVELPYAAKEFSMFIVLPNDGHSISTCLTHLDDIKLEELTSGLSEQNTVLKLPKFKFKWGTKSLKSDLKSLGMKKIFSDSEADFRLLSNVQIGDLFVSDVVHQTFIDVNEAGTEAAAATAIIVETSGDTTPFKLIANRAFIFLIKDNNTGALLFMGVLANPTK